MKQSPLKKHAFWFLFGAVPLLVVIGVLTISMAVGGDTEKLKTAYEAQKKEVADAKPKGKGVGAKLSQQKGELDTKVTALWGENYLQQKKAKLFKWPNTGKPDAENKLAILEKRDLPFGDDFLVQVKDGEPPQSLIDVNQSELGEFVTAYPKAFKEMVEKVAPTRFGTGTPAGGSGGGEGPGGPGIVAGGPGGGRPGMGPGPGPGGMPPPASAGGGLLNTTGGEPWQAVLRHVSDTGWDSSGRKPTPQELWLALEDIWVQRELLEVIARTNAALTKFESEFTFWKYDPLKRTFKSRLWELDLEVMNDPDTPEAKQAAAEKRPVKFDPSKAKFLKATLRNPSDRLQLLGARKVLRLKVWLDNPTDLQPTHFGEAKVEEYVLGGELVPGRGTLDVPLDKERPDPKDPKRRIAGGHRITDNINWPRIARVEQILDEISVPVKLIQSVELGVTDHRRQAATLVAPKLKGLPEDPPAGDATSGTGGAAGAPLPGGRGGGGDGLEGGRPGPGGPGAATGAVAGGAKRGPKEAVLLGNKLRYLEVTDQVRRMPVAISVVLDESFRQDLLVQFANSPIRFHSTQVGWQRFRGTLPATATAPPRGGAGGAGGVGLGGDGMEGSPGGVSGPSSAAVTAQANAGLITLAIYGVVSLYNEMPVREIDLKGDTFETESTDWKKPVVVARERKAELTKDLLDAGNKAFEELIPDEAIRDRVGGAVRLEGKEWVRKDIDFRSFDLLAFAWEGPPDSKVTFTVTGTEKPAADGKAATIEQSAKFGLAPGNPNAETKVLHRKLFAVRRTVKWTAE